MNRRHLVFSLLPLASLALFISGCGSSDSPTEPNEPNHRPAVRLIGENLSAGPLWLPKWSDTGFLTPVQVRPGSSVEMLRHSHSGEGIELRGGRFLVYRPDADGPAPIEVWAEVEYNLSAVKTNPGADVALAVRISVDGGGSLLVSTDRPEVFHLVQVHYW